MAGHTAKAHRYRSAHTQKVAHQLAAVLAAEPELLTHPCIEDAPELFRRTVAERIGRTKYVPSDWTWKLAVAHARKLAK